VSSVLIIRLRDGLEQ